jgi:putative membrane protein
MLLDTKLPFTYIINRIMPDVVRVLLISVFFQVVKYYFADYLPQIPLQLPTILGGCISLLLAFKIGQSYDRWWEARKVWGAIVNDSRTLLMQVSSFIPEAQLLHDAPAPLLRTVAYRQIAWCYSLGQSLRGLDPLAGLTSLLASAELAELPRHANKPLAILGLHTQQLKALHQQQALNDFQQVQLDSTLLRLCESMGQAERIKNTVFPSSYRLLVYLFIYVFLTTLSLGLVETIGIWEAPVLLTIASSFFLLERTARYLQDPFNNKPTDTPVTAIARTIEINLRQLLHETEVPAPCQAKSYYLM